jgi:hypothetical protein
MRTRDPSRASRRVLKVPAPEVIGSPYVPHHALAGVAAGRAGKLAFEGCSGGPAAQPFLFDGGGDESRVARLRGTVDDEGGTRQRMERRANNAVGVEIVRSCRATVQGEDSVPHRIGCVGAKVRVRCGGRRRPSLHRRAQKVLAPEKTLSA